MQVADDSGIDLWQWGMWMKEEVSKEAVAVAWIIRWLRDAAKSKHKEFMTFVVICLVAGAILAGDYGQGWDEWIDFRHGELSLAAYYDPQAYVPGLTTYYHAPFYFMIWTGLSKALHGLFPELMPAGARHLINYLTFIMAIICLYSLALRIFRNRIALAVSLAFALQPMLFGQAFINHKDIPFMAFFLLSVLLGVHATNFLAGDIKKGSHQAPNWRSQFSAMFGAWISAGRWARLGILGMVAVSILLTMDVAFQILVYPMTESLVRYAYQHPFSPVIGGLFRLVAEDYHKTPLGLYLEKLDQAYFWAKYLLPAGSWLLLGFRLTRFFRGALAPEILKLCAGLCYWLLAGAIVGLTTSIRIIGLFAGALVTIYAIAALKRRVIPCLMAYFVSCFSAIYMAWPALWGDPVRRFAERILGTIDYEAHLVLFEGRMIPSPSLPWQYVPKIYALKLTETALVLITLGVILCIAAWVRKASPHPLLLIGVVWFLIPAIGAALQMASFYGERQIFFTLPPLFLFLGVGLNALLDRIKTPWAQSAILVAILIPGTLGIVKLHPYEYVYYNSLAGGVRGAEGRYQLDYWCTSYREAMEYINDVAPMNANIKVWGPSDAAREFAREDLKVFPLDSFDADYILGCSRALRNPDFFSEGEVAYEVVIDGAVIAVVKTPPDMDDS